MSISSFPCPSRRTERCGCYLGWMEQMSRPALALGSNDHHRHGRFQRSSHSIGSTSLKNEGRGSLAVLGGKSNLPMIKMDIHVCKTFSAFHKKSAEAESAVLELSFFPSSRNHRCHTQLNLCFQGLTSLLFSFFSLLQIAQGSSRKLF